MLSYACSNRDSSREAHRGDIIIALSIHMQASQQVQDCCPRAALIRRLLPCRRVIVLSCAALSACLPPASSSSSSSAPPHTSLLLGNRPVLHATVVPARLGSSSRTSTP